MGMGWTTEVTSGKAPPSKPKIAPVASVPAPPAAPVEERDPEAPRPPVARAPAARVPKAAAGAAALAATLEGDASATALVLTLTRAARFATFTLADPHRIVVDLQDVDFRIPPATGTTGRGLIKSFRYGLLAPGKSRIVIDVTAPVSIEKAEIVALRGAATVQLRVAVIPTSRDTFLATAVAVPALPQPSGSHAQQGVANASLGAAPPGAAKRPKSSKPVIVLDPGHGGLDAGTLGASAGVAEKDVVLRFAKQLRDKLRATGRFDVHLTREIDIFVRLDERVRLARELGCDLFISLHTDSVPAQIAHLNVRGATIYTMSELSGDARAQQLAEKENLSDVIAGVEVRQDEQPEVATILTDLMRRETANHSLNFTNTLLGHMKKTTGLSREPHRHAAFKVLRAPDMPSVLVELGFLSNKEDEKLLASKAWQEQVAGSVTQAVESFFAKRVARSSN